jgi:hypothetical protein
MKANSNKVNALIVKENKEEDNYLEGYPVYPDNEDIYNKFRKGRNIDPEDISKTKDIFENTKAVSNFEKDISDNDPGGELDIPGSELDDSQEIIGSEDEENNYYSLGGDDHNDLDEDKDDL